MLAEEIQDEKSSVGTDEAPTFGVIDDGRTYPAVTARRRQQNGSKRETIFTVSKFGKYAELYPEFESRVIEPYRERKRKRAESGGHPSGDNANTVGSGSDTPREKFSDGRSPFGFSVNTVE